MLYQIGRAIGSCLPWMPRFDRHWASDEALKHGFPDGWKDAWITVRYDAAGTNWKLSVADNGIGRPDGVFAQVKTGLGTSIVKALAHQLGAQVETLTGPQGTTVSVTRATFSVKARVAWKTGTAWGSERTLMLPEGFPSRVMPTRSIRLRATARCDASDARRSVRLRWSSRVIGSSSVCGAA
jgi:hypothetical protein